MPRFLEGRPRQDRPEPLRHHRRKARARAELLVFARDEAAADKTWGYEEFQAFIKNPKVAIPGTKMAFAGLSKEQDRINLTAYLRTLSDSPLAIPAPNPAAPPAAPAGDGTEPASEVQAPPPGTAPATPAPGTTTPAPGGATTPAAPATTPPAAGATPATPPPATTPPAH